MKFYYKGEQIRTSKTHNYTHAVLREKEEGGFVVWCCASSFALASKQIDKARRLNPAYQIVELEQR